MLKKSLLIAASVLSFGICNANAFDIKGIKLGASFNDLPGFAKRGQVTLMIVVLFDHSLIPIAESI